MLAWVCARVCVPVCVWACLLMGESTCALEWRAGVFAFTKRKEALSDERTARARTHHTHTHTRARARDGFDAHTTHTCGHTQSRGHTPGRP